MNDDEVTTNDTPPKKKRGRGGRPRSESGLPTIAEARLMERAIRNRWPIRDEAKAPIMDRMSSLALNPESGGRVAVAAARVILSADRLNQADEHHAEGSTLHVEHAAADVTALADEMRKEADYVSYVRDRASASDTDAGTIRQVGLVADAGTVGNGEPHVSPGSRINGDRNGEQ